MIPFPGPSASIVFERPVPLFACAVLTYVGTLAAALAAPDRTPRAALAALLAGAVLLAALRGSTRLATLAALAMAGLLAAEGTRRAERRCVSAAARATVWRVQLHRQALSAAVARGVVRQPGCDVPVTMFVRSGQAEAGAQVWVRGRGQATPRGLVITDARLAARRPAPILWRTRARASRAVGAVFARDTPLARALLLADMRELPPELRDRWGASGLVHMLSVSGLHVGLLAGAVLLALRAMRLSPTAAECGGLALVIGYVLTIGAPAPAVRAATMLSASAASRILQRPVSPWSILAIGSLHPVLSPRVATDLGWQLSVAGIVALAAAGALMKRVDEDRISGWRRMILTGLVTSTLATIVTLPFTAPVFGRASVVAPLTNLVASPLMAVAQPTLFLGLALAPLLPLARVVADAVHPVLQALDAVAALGASIPFATIAVPATPFAVGLLAVIALGAVVACFAERSSRGWLPAACGVALLPWVIARPTTSGWAELHVIDVGQGDAVALRSGRGRWILVDAGRSWRGGDAGRGTVVPYLRRRGGALAAVIITHAHADHVGGIASVVRALRPALLYDPAYVAPGGAYRDALVAARAVGTRWRRVRPGDSLVVDDVVLEFLAPDSAWTASLEDPNDASTVAVARIGAVRFLLTGDAERAEEAWLLDRRRSLRADVLKVAHHGSSTSSTDAWLDAVRPRVAIVSVGALNGYGHPSVDRMRALVRRGARVLRTDRLGTVVIRTDGTRLVVQADGQEWPIARDSLPP